MKAQVILNEQHSLLSSQTELLNAKFGSDWEILSIPSQGLTKQEQLNFASKLWTQRSPVVFASPIPLLLAKVVSQDTTDSERGGGDGVWLFHNDKREKKQLPDGKIIMVVAKEGWELERI